MAGDIPTLQSLDRPEKFQDVLKRDRQEDCLGCKVVGMFDCDLSGLFTLF